MCETIEANLTEMAENNSGVRQLVGNVNKQSRHKHHEWEENRRQAESSNGGDQVYRRDNSGRMERENSFATPDLSGGDHR